MTSFVLDCSVAISWFINDENNDMGSLERASRDGAIVPSIWPLEVSNVLLNAKRRGRITMEQMRTAIHSLAELPIIIDDLTAKYAWQETIELAEQYNLSQYDASYLELALRFGVPIATFDQQLIEAAKKRNISVISNSL